MTNKFSANAHHLRHNHEIYIATMRLALEDYQVLRTVTSQEGPSIEIDRPLEGVEVKIAMHGNQKYASAQKWKCRIFWRI